VSGLLLYYQCVSDKCSVSNGDLPATDNVIIVGVITLIPTQLLYKSNRRYIDYNYELIV